MLKKSSNSEINSLNIQSNIYNNKNYINNVNNNIITNSMQNYP